MDQEQRALLADKMSDAANLTGGALVLGQFVSGVPFSTLVAAVGLVVWFALLGAAVTLTRTESVR